MSESATPQATTSKAPAPLPPSQTKVGKAIMLVMHIAVITASALLVVLISLDALHNVSFLTDPRYLHYQFWICILFMLDIVVSFFYSDHRLKYFLVHIVFFAICIPYVNIFGWLHVRLTPELHYVLRTLPILRVAYIVGSMAGGVNRRRIRGMFAAYITLLVTVTYLSSLMFFVEEHMINPQVHTYWSALYWTILNLTTVGCDIMEYSLIGKILAVILSGLGLVLFPVFTVYIASLFTETPTDPSGSSDQSASAAGDSSASTPAPADSQATATT